MKEGIHPKYGEAVVRCACGEVHLQQVLLKKKLGLKFVQNVIHFLLENRNLLILVAELIDLKENIIFKIVRQKSKNMRLEYQL